MDNGILTPNNTPSKIPSEISIVQQVKTKKEVLNTENVQPKNEIEKPIVFDSVVTIYHTVQRNESVGIIAQKYNVTPEDIKKWNNMSSNWVGIAQQLKILVNVKLMQPELAGKQIDTKQPLKPITNQTKPIKKFYSVKPGDNLIKIADSYGLTVEQMKELNPKIDPNSIRVGEIIRVK